MRGSDKKSQYFTLGLNSCIENKVDILLINNWRASLVPAAAVIPALMVYANIVAVKKLVVGYFRVSILCDLNELPKKIDYAYFSQIWSWTLFSDHGISVFLL